MERYRRVLVEIGNGLVADPAVWEAHARWSRGVIEECLGEPADARRSAISPSPTLTVGAGGFDADRISPADLAEAGRVLFAVASEALAETADHGRGEGRSAAAAGIALQHEISRGLEAETARREGAAARRRSEVETEVRREIAREIHDRIGGSVFLAIRQLELFQVLNGSRGDAEAMRIEAVRSALLQLSADTRSLVTDLRGRRLTGSLASALRSFAGSAAFGDAAVEIRVDGDEAAMPTGIRDSVFIVAREFLRNALSHARALNIAIHVDVEPAKIDIYVVDDGVGFDISTARPANGLSGARERVELLDGTLHISSACGRGTRVIISIPIKPPESELAENGQDHFSR